MKEFISAVEDVVNEDNPELDSDGKPVEKYIAFKVDGRELRAYEPTDGQLTFMLAALGRGQTKDQRFASIINIMLETLRDDDRDYMESRLLTRDPKKRLPVSTIEKIFEHLTEEWFARPTQSPSDSAPSPQTGGAKSTQRTTKSTSSANDPTDS